MANETQITLIGNLTSDPEIRYTNNGTPVASFTIATTPRTYNRNTNQWEDGQTLFMRCNAWKTLAELTQQLHKGQKVIATGRLAQHSWEKDGQTHTNIETTIDTIGAALTPPRETNNPTHNQQTTPTSTQPTQNTQTSFTDPWTLPNEPAY